jgi:hypothetical protein
LGVIAKCNGMATRQLAIASVLCVFATQIALSQVPDTLDPRGYFPLAVGNTWEYVHYAYRPVNPWRPTDESITRFERYEVLNSQVRQDTTFFQLLHRIQTEDGVFVAADTFEIWFDPEYASVKGVNREILSLLRCLDSPYGINHEHDPDCWPFVTSEEVYEPQLFGTQGPVASKRFGSFGWSFEVVHGVGLNRGGGGCEPCGPFEDEDQWTLRYASVDDREYGARVVGVETGTWATHAGFVLYPNPASDNLTIETWGSGHIEIFDMLGRRMQSIAADSSGIISISVKDYFPGLYVIRMGGRARTFVVR